jgi:hypothetical protein
MGPYYGAPMIDHDSRARSTATSPTCSATSHASSCATKLRVRAVLAVAELHRAALSRGSTATPKAYTDLYADCAFASCPDEPPHPWFIGGNARSTRGSRERRASLDWLLRRRQREWTPAIGRVLAELDAQGLAESTLVVFMSDNGMNCGHHGIWGKGNGRGRRTCTTRRCRCRASCRSRVASPRGRVSDAMLSGLRPVFPTLARVRRAFAATPVDQSPDAAFAASWKGSGDRADAPVVVYDEYGPVRMVRTSRWKYVHRHPDGPHELFDLADDPGERTNRVDDPSLDDVRASLRQQLDDWFRTYVDPVRDGVDKGVTGCGQLGRIEPDASARTLFADSHMSNTDWDLWVPTDDGQTPSYAGKGGSTS